MASTVSEVSEKTKDNVDHAVDQGAAALNKGADKMQDFAVSALNYINKSVKSKPMTSILLSALAGVFLTLCCRKTE